ncbi:MAG: hypothetical protein ACE5PV_16915 [Candidatus Poribacteria bacterium]
MQYDVAAKVVVEHGKEEILRSFLGIEPEHVVLEFQTRWKWDVPLRLLEYTTMNQIRIELSAA